MTESKITVCNSEGLQARNSAKVVKLSNRFPCDVWIHHEDDEANAKSIMGLMMLAAAQGTELTIITEGEQKQEAMKQITELISSGFSIEI